MTKAPASQDVPKTGPCRESALRAVPELGEKDPLGGGYESYFYDVLKVHACSNEMALIEANHSAGSTYNYWVLIADSDSTWKIGAIAGVGSDTPQSAPLFNRAEIDKGTGGKSAELLDLVGDLPGGRPLFE
ncbi:hypothetical protein ABGB12_27965 [Actinocorallia sp. B10E7]|uniref:hypothetical protein n=1 Tax=Actinocorallia sp. B10E7 TaxID=3153558 RepID=UPI00325D17FE